MGIWNGSAGRIQRVVRELNFMSHSSPIRRGNSGFHRAESARPKGESRLRRSAVEVSCLAESVQLLPESSGDY